MLNSLFPSIPTQEEINDKLDEMHRLMEQLTCKEKDIRDEVRNEELQARKKIKSEVSLWLDQVSSIEKEVESIEAEAEKVGLKDFLVKLKGLVSRIGELIKKGEFPRGVVLDILNPPPLVTEKMEGSTPSMVQDQVWRCFERGETRIGVYGMGGVGKTTMAMDINNKCLKPNPFFDTVYYVTVSRDTSVSKLQHDVANALGIRFNYQDEPKRAAELSAALKQRQNCLLILDDVWEDISMSKVGVSAEGGGCKLLITTRKLDVIRRMNCVAVKLEPLTEDESWDLFVKKLGDYEALSEEAKHTARSVAKECGRLPLAIITVAGSMRGETSEPVWRDALTMLKCIKCSCQIEMEENVYSTLRFSYERLKDETHRKCFLHCALYPEDYKIEREELISLFIAVGLVDGGNNRSENVDKSHAILNHLADTSLLEHTTDWLDRRCVKMHDLVRDMALREIGASGMVKAGISLTRVPPEVEWNNENLELVSLMSNNIWDFGGVNSPHCPKVSVLWLQGNPRLSFIPGSFFVQMIGLKVLNLSRTDIQVLPRSVSGLFNLNNLLLVECDLLELIPSLAELTTLREINIKGCWSMEKFPYGMEELVSLEYLNLRGSGIKGLHSGIFCKQGNLEVFLSNDRVIVRAEELMSLRHLERLDGCHFADVCEFNQCVEVGCFGPNQHPRLTDYCFSVGFVMDAHEVKEHHRNHLKRRIFVNKYCWSTGIERRLLLPANVEFLQFRECSFRGRSLLGAVPSLCHVTKLEFCELRSCKGVEYIIPVPDEWSNPLPLEGIQELWLEKLKDFIGLISRGGLRDHGGVLPYTISFGGLKRLELQNCPKVERLWLSNLKLPNLEDIRIDGCEKVKEIFATAKGETITLPKLLNLELRDLRELKSVWCDNDVSFPNLLKILINCCGEVRMLGFTSFNMPSLEIIEIRNCPKMKEIFTTAKGETITLPKLLNLELRYLRELRSLWCDNDVYLPNLLKIVLDNCGEVRELGCTSLNMPSLEIIEINDCPKMKEIFTRQDETGDETAVEMPNLKEILLDEVPELRSICRSTIVCNSLQLLHVTTDLKDIAKLESCPISIPRLFQGHNNNDSPPRLELWRTSEAECISDDWWESLHWNDTATKSRLHQLDCFSVNYY